MNYGKIKGIDKKVSRLIIGTMDFNNRERLDEYVEMLDYAYELGINAIDTAQGYGGGVAEDTIHKWLVKHDNRDEVVITSKGCHHNVWRNRVNRFDMGSDLLDTTSRMRIDYVDLLYLHRDDLAVPIPTIVEAVNEHYRSGRLKAAGAANWSYERIKEFNEYAEANGLIGFSLAESHYSIAEQLDEPFWRDSGTISGPKYAEAREYFAKNNLPISSYSPLSGGFITGRITRELFANDPESIARGTRRAYCHEINFKRLDRTAELAKQKGVSIAQIGLAYTMSSDMDVYPIIGAKNKEEILSCVEAVDIKLTKEECDWLDLTID